MKIGSIEFSGRTIGCLIRNKCGTGAPLEVVSPVGIPAQFTLLIAAERIRCTAIWRTEFVPLCPKGPDLLEIQDRWLAFSDDFRALTLFGGQYHRSHHC